MNATKQIAQRIVNAHQQFVNNCIEQFNVSKEEAEIALECYIKFKIVKLDPNIGQYKLKHGAFWNKEIITNAIKGV